MDIGTDRLTLIVLAAVFAGAFLGSGFTYYQVQEEVESFDNRLEQASNTNIVYINSSDRDLSPLFDKVDQSVVYISSSGNNRSSNGQGSGFVYDEQGHIVTNEHVVEDARRVQVSFTDGSTKNAEVVGMDPYSDLAVLKVQKQGLKPLDLGNSSSVEVGQEVVAIGNPFGLRGSMTAGIISQKGRSLPVQREGLEGFRIRDVIQTDASINPGNSGGPLLNVQGEVIGVNTAIESRTGTFSGIGFAVPSNTVSRVAPEIIDDGEAEHPWIGVAGRNMNEDLANEMELNTTSGFLVMNVSDGGPAEEAGLRAGNRTVTIDDIEYTVGGDVIVAINDQEMRGIEDILTFLNREAEVGEEVIITVIRNGEEVDIPLVLDSRPVEE